jgi:hypothetical protein
MKGKKGFFQGKDSAETTIKIDGDTLTMKDDDGKTGTLTRLEPK